MNRRARLRLRGLASLADPAHALAGDSGALVRRELCDLPTDRANAADGVGAAIASRTDAPGIADAPVASDERAHSELRDGVVRGAVAPTEPLDGAAVNRGRVLRALRALRMARALRLAIALGMAPGAGVE